MICASRKYSSLSLCLSLAFALMVTTAALAAPGGKGGGNGGGSGGGNGGGKSLEACNDHLDNDGDGFCDFASKRGYCSDGSQLGDPDCSSPNDSSESCTPEAETCDGQDNDCDDLVDEAGVCDTEYYCDADQDSYRSAGVSGSCTTYGCMPAACGETAGTDCDDTSAAVNPAAVDNCDSDGVDNDCDGAVDECDPCTNNVRDGSESDVDCGGTCAACEIGQGCGADSDCLSGLCTTGICAVPDTNLDPRCVPLKYENGTLVNHVNLVFVPSGFEGDMTKFGAEVERIAGIFAEYVPFDASISSYNVLYVPEESGSFCSFSSTTSRLLSCSTATARTISSLCTSDARQTIVVHDDTQYGGAGYRYADVATTSIHDSAPRVAVHELGHSLFSLADEYNYVENLVSGANCASEGCPDWQDMIGYNGIGCLNNSCYGGAYYVGENSVMKSLGYPFEEVNERLACCSYRQETGGFPAYCNQFTQFPSSTDLGGFCLNPTGSGAPPLAGDYLSAPIEATLVLDADTGQWNVESVTPRRPGFYPTVEARGEGKGAIALNVLFANDDSRQLRFEELEDVEFPGEGGELGGYVKLPREVITIVVESSGKGPIKSIGAARASD